MKAPRANEAQSRPIYFPLIVQDLWRVHQCGGCKFEQDDDVIAVKSSVCIAILGWRLCFHVVWASPAKDTHVRTYSRLIPSRVHQLIMKSGFLAKLLVELQV